MVGRLQLDRVYSNRDGRSTRENRSNRESRSTREQESVRVQRNTGEYRNTRVQRSTGEYRNTRVQRNTEEYRNTREQRNSRDPRVNRVNVNERQEMDRRKAIEAQRIKREQHRAVRAKRKKRKLLRIILTLILIVVIAGGATTAYILLQSPYKNGNELLIEKRYAESITLFQEAIEKEQDVPESYRGLALAYWELENYEQSEIALLESLSLGAEETSAVHNMLATLRLEEGNYQEALPHIERALELGVSNAALKQELMYHEIMCYEDAADWETAKVKAAEYLELYPDDERVQREAKFLETR